MTSESTPKTILLMGCPRALEAPAAVGTIKPGMLIERTAAGTVRPHSTVGTNIGRAARLFAKEADFLGKDIDDTYASSDTVPYYTCVPGDRIYAWLSAGNDVSIGDYLQSDGAGALELVDSDGHAVAQAVEAVDNDPGSGGAAVRIKVEVI